MLGVRGRDRREAPPPVTAGARLAELERQFRRIGSDAAMVQEARQLARRAGEEIPDWARPPSPGATPIVGDPELTLEAAVKHAERFGVEEVYETAEASGLGPEELGRLRERLVKIDRGRHDEEVAARAARKIEDVWRLDHDARERLIERLLNVTPALEDARIARLAGISRRTAQERRRAATQDGPHSQ